MNCKNWLVLWVLAVLICTAAGKSQAQIQWQIQTGDFKTIVATIDSISDASIAMGEKKIAIADFLSGVRSGAVVRPAGRFSLHLVDGQILSGEPVKTADEKLTWKQPTLGELTIRMKDIAAMTLGAGDNTLLNQQRKEDVAVLANGDLASGVLVGISATSVTIKANGNDVEAPVDSLAGLYLASTPTIATSKPEIRLQLVDGSKVTGSNMAFSNDQFTFDVAGEPGRRIGVDNVVAIEQLNGPVMWLSSIPMTTCEQTPYLGAKWPTNIDRTASGGVIRFHERTFTRGIGVHSRSKIVYAVPETCQAFRTLYAVDGQRPLADMDIRILLDGKVLHEQKRFRAGQLAGPIVLDVAGAKELTLEVDYGEGLDTQDQLNWIEPAFLKRAPDSK